MSRSGAWRLLRKDFGRKTVALTLAVLVWLLLSLLVSGGRDLKLEVRIVAKRAEAEQNRNSVPAIYVVVPPHLIVRNLVHGEVTVHLKGLRRDIDEVELHAILEVPPDVMAGKDEREYFIVLESGMIRSRTGAPKVSDEISFSPRQVRLLLAEKTSQTFDLGPINVSTTGVPRPGHAIDNSTFRVSPNQVTLTGPKSAIAMLEANPALLQFSPVNVEGQSYDVMRQVRLDPEKVDRGITLDTVGNAVMVTVPIRPHDVERELLSVPVEYQNEEFLATRDQRLVEATESLDLKVIGPPSVLDPLSEKQLRAAIALHYDWRTVSLPQASDPVRVLDELPDSVRFTDTHDRELRIEYRLEMIEPDAGLPTGGDSP